MSHHHQAVRKERGNIFFFSNLTWFMFVQLIFGFRNLKMKTQPTHTCHIEQGLIKEAACCVNT